MENRKFLPFKSDAKKSFGNEVAVSLASPRDNAFLILDFKEIVNPIEWVGQHKDLLLKCMVEHGVVFLKNISIQKDKIIPTIKQLVPAETLLNSYRGGVTGRPKIDENLFLTTELPGDQAILQHHEMSYIKGFPKKVFFYCHNPAEHGGATPMAFSRRIKLDLRKSLYEEFKKRGICYVRNYHQEFGENSKLFVDWKKAFEIKSKSELNKIASESEFSFEWIGENQLRTRNFRPGIVRHPITNEEFIFNHTVVLNLYSPNEVLSPALRATFTGLTENEVSKLKTLPAFDQPYLMTWGDTQEIIPNELIEELFQVYNQNKVSVSWQKGDLMLVDNILASHGRDQYLGKREVYAILSSHEGY